METTVVLGDGDEDDGDLLVMKSTVPGMFGILVV